MNLFTIRRFTIYDWYYSVSNILKQAFKRVTSIVHRKSSNRKSPHYLSGISVNPQLYS